MVSNTNLQHGAYVDVIPYAQNVHLNGTMSFIYVR